MRPDPQPRLAYDFDILYLFGDEVFADPDRRAALYAAGIDHEMRANRIALFRDPRTAAALRAAPAAVRDLFLAAGFGLAPHTSGLPRLRYPAEDEAARRDLIARLIEKTAAFDLPKPADYPDGEAGFRLGDFMLDLASAERIPPAGPRTPPSIPRAAPRGRGLLAPALALLCLAAVTQLPGLASAVAGLRLP